jgi:hypothetical protein
MSNSAELKNAGGINWYRGAKNGPGAPVAGNVQFFRPWGAARNFCRPLIIKPVSTCSAGGNRYFGALVFCHLSDLNSLLLKNFLFSSGVFLLCSAPSRVIIGV